VKIGAVDSTANLAVDAFNQLVMGIFNLGSGNLLLENNILTWNLWAGSPELVNQDEWQHHAEYWRYSIGVNHRPPVGEGTGITDINGKPFDPGERALAEKLDELAKWMKAAS
jgi:hypothetical protein